MAKRLKKKKDSRSKSPGSAKKKPGDKPVSKKPVEPLYTTKQPNQSNGKKRLSAPTTSFNVSSSGTRAVSAFDGYWVVQPQNLPSVHRQLAAHATALHSIAVGLGVLIMFATGYLPGGYQAANAISGFSHGEIPIRTMQIFMLLDTVFPIFFLTGLGVLATALQTRIIRPIIRLILTALLVIMVSDLIENALAYSAIVNGTKSDFQFPITAVKFGGLIVVGVLMSVILPRNGMLMKILNGLLRFGIPAGIALLLADLVDPGFRYAFGAGFVIVLVLLAFCSQMLAEAE